MVAERFEQVVAHLEQARARWVVMHDHYVRFCERSMDMADAGCAAKGIIPKRIGDDLYVQYLDRRLRISFGFDRISDRGVLCVDDLSAVGRYEGRHPVRIETISFNAAGDLDVVDADGVSSLNCRLPAVSKGDPFPSRSRHALVSRLPTVVSALFASATAICWPFT